MNIFKSNKAFTLIELVIIIVVLGIIVLLAIPKFSEYTAAAKLAQIGNDVKVHENITEAGRINNPEFTSGWESIGSENLESYRSSKSLFDKKGEVTDSEEFNGDYFIIPSNLVNSKLKGDFLMSDGGKVFYHDEELNSVGDNNNEVDSPNYTEYVASDDDFEWVSYDWEYHYIGPDDSKGYFNYIGTGESIVEIPHTIQGVEVTSYTRMFHNTGGDVTKVISTNENVTAMPEMFDEFQGDNLDLSELDTSNVTNMLGMFAETTLGELNISNFNTSNVDIMNGEFSYDGSSGHGRGSGLFDGSEVNEVILGDGFITSKVKSFDKMFSYAEIGNLREVLSKVNTDSATSMSGMFQNVKVEGELNSSTFELLDTSNVTDMSGMFMFSKFDSIDLSDIDTSNVENMDRMFDYASSSIINVANFNTAKVKSMHGMFSSSGALSLNLSSFETTNVTRMSDMFRNVPATSIDVSSFDTSKVESMAGMFSWSKFNSLDLRSFDTSSVINFNDMFRGSKAVEGLARTQEDANNFNSSVNIPSTLTFNLQ